MTSTQATEDPQLTEERRTLSVLLQFGLLVLGAGLCVGLPFPVRAAGIGFALAALIVGGRAFLRVRRRPRKGVGPVFVGVGIGLAGTLLLWHLVLLAVTPLLADHETCLRRALTVEATQRCQSALDERLANLRRASVGEPAGR